MAHIAVQNIGVNGGDVVFTPASASDTLDPIAKQFVLVKNGGLAEAVVTVPVPGNTTYGEANPPKDYTVPAGGVGGFATVKEFVDKVANTISITVPDPTGIEYAAVLVG